MSGKELNKSDKYLNEEADEGEENIEEQADDDFGDFEGFNNVNELEASVAQPLPQALQANWGTFPDYVPSQRTMSSSLQPDLLPTQASIGDLSGCISTNHDSGDDQYEPPAIANLPQLHLHPDLARSDFQLPDVSPQGAEAKMPLLGNLPDISPVGCRPSHLSDLPDVSETRSKVVTLPPKCDSGSASASSSVLEFPPCCSKSLANESPKSGLHGNNNNDNIEVVVSDFQQKFEALNRQNNTLVQNLSEMKLQNVQFQNQLSECVSIIHHQNETRQEESSSLRNEISRLCDGLANVKATSYDRSCSTLSAADQDAVTLEVKLSEQANSVDELQKRIASQDEQISELRSEVRDVSRKIDEMQQEVVGAMKQMMDEFKRERQDLARKVESMERTLQESSSQVDRKVDQRMYTAALLDTLLLGARNKLQELVKPENGPSS